MKCKNCGNKRFYLLKDDYLKCKDCNKKYSKRKLELNLKIIDCFCENLSALDASKKLQLNYRTVKDRYDFYRINITKYLEDKYNSSYSAFKEYEEYRYSYNNKDFINIMGFVNNDIIYTILLPDYVSFSNKENKIYSEKFYQTKLYDFWKYLDDKLKIYKGISKDRFILYVKEFEFKFNYDKFTQKEILLEF